MSSPANWEKLGRDWNKVAQQPSGTGPWKMDQFVPRTKAELVRNAAYWDRDRIPKTDRQILMPVPDSNTRVSALLSGQVGLDRGPIPGHVRPPEGGRHAGGDEQIPACLAVYAQLHRRLPAARHPRPQSPQPRINRDEIVALLSGSAMPAKGMVYPGHPWFGTPSFDLKYDPDAARKLLAEAGYTAAKPLKLQFGVSTSGSGQMQPAPMNDAIQQNMKEVGVDLSFQVLEWETLRGRRRAGAAAPECKGLDGLNNSWGFWDPDIALLNEAWSVMKPPAGANWGSYFRPHRRRVMSESQTRLRPGRAGQDPRPTPHLYRRPGHVDLGGARPQPPRPQPQGQRLRGSPELVPGFDADPYGLVLGSHRSPGAGGSRNSEASSPGHAAPLARSPITCAKPAAPSSQGCIHP